jgi:hypothetical protein
MSDYIQPLSKSDESKIMRGIEQAIGYTNNDGMTPSAAIAKVASAGDYGPEKIARMVEAFNESKSVFMLSKLAEDNRADSFPLANTQEVLGLVYKEADTPADSSTKGLSTLNLSQMFNIKKEASEKKEPVKSARGEEFVVAHQQKEAQAACVTAERNEQDVRIEKMAVELSVGELADHMRPLTDKELKKVARVTVNRYGVKGQQLMGIMGAKLDRGIPELSKTANAVVLPLQEPYITISKTMEKLSTYNEVVKKKAELDKQAALSDVVNSIAPFGMDEILSDGAQEAKEIPQPNALDVLDPNIEARLKSLKANQEFTNLLTDKFVQNYDVQDVAEAYNAAVQMAPNLQGSSRDAILTTIVRKNLAQGNIHDVAEASQVTKLNKDL